MGHRLLLCSPGNIPGSAYFGPKKAQAVNQSIISSRTKKESAAIQIVRFAINKNLRWTIGLGGCKARETEEEACQEWFHALREIVKP